MTCSDTSSHYLSTFFFYLLLCFPFLHWIIHQAKFAGNLSSQNCFPVTLTEWHLWWNGFPSVAEPLLASFPFWSVGLFSFCRFFFFFFCRVCNPFFLCPWKLSFNPAQTICCVLKTFSLFNQLFYGITFICIIFSSDNLQSADMKHMWVLAGVAITFADGVLFMCLYLSCLRSAGGLYKEGGAESSPVMWYCAENPLSDMSRRSAHAQTEASDHTQRPQGLFLLGWVNNVSKNCWIIKYTLCALTQN